MQLLLDLLLKRLGVTRSHRVSIRRGIEVPTPDGVQLLTDLYLVRPVTRRPVILIRSPYGRSIFLASMTAYPLAVQGYHVVLQSCRGTFGSTGTFDPHHDEQRDGLTAIEWIKQQPWYGGKIGTFGGSYLGYTQWALAAAAGPEVRAMAMQVTLSDFAQMTYGGESFALENAFSWTRTVSLARRRKLMALRMLIPSMRRRLELTDQQWRTLPISAMDREIIGERVPFWQDWMLHNSAGDPWWQSMNFHSSIAGITCPITMVAGWYDIFVPWQVRDFTALRNAGVDARITIGPWGHTDAEAVPAGLRDALDWFNHHLRGGRLDVDRKCVKLFIVGADEWRHFDAWPPTEAKPERWYLQPHRRLIGELPPESRAEEFIYDPADPTPSLGGPALKSVPFAVDNAPLESRTDVLSFTSAPFPSQREIVGAIRADIYLASSAASADVFVRVCDVDRTGVSRNICDGLQRVKLLSRDPQCVSVDLWPTAYRLQEGHSLRVQISSGAFPRWARNLGDGDLTQGSQMHRARQSIFHSPAYPSSVSVPFLA